uniref:NADH dehydrogenase subunit 6 n=1 Tax=Cerion tridentatum costellata TaxID=1108932 RepID=A0A1W6Q5H6_9EUPU|nr:NADH dehydrogenase subunit 6 [Cerion tridentatum costellata]
MASVILYILMILSYTLIVSLSPLQIALILLMMSVLFSVLVAMVISSWLAYLLFLIYVGGILVLFMFMVFLSTNQILGLSRLGMICLSMMGVLFTPLLLLSQFDVDMKNSLGLGQGASFEFSFGVWAVFLGVTLLGSFLGISEALFLKGKVVSVAYE